MQKRDFAHAVRAQPSAKQRHSNPVHDQGLKRSPHESSLSSPAIRMSSSTCRPSAHTPKVTSTGTRPFEIEASLAMEAMDPPTAITHESFS